MSLGRKSLPENMTPREGNTPVRDEGDNGETRIIFSEVSIGTIVVVLVLSPSISLSSPYPTVKRDRRRGGWSSKSQSKETVFTVRTGPLKR